MQPSNIGPSFAKSNFDHLEIDATGRKVGNTDTPALTAILARLNVDGFTHSQGREANLQAFSFAREKIFNAAGRAAVQAWLAGAS
jgi:hypothetical protein